MTLKHVYIFIPLHSFSVKVGRPKRPQKAGIAKARIKLQKKVPFGTLTFQTVLPRIFAAIRDSEVNET